MPIEGKTLMVVLAQLAEHRIVVPSVVGSSPTFHPKTAEYLMVSPLFFCVNVYGAEANPPGSPRILILGESAAQGEYVLQGLARSHMSL